MAKMTWTTQQKKVIDVRDCNVLVSAAAGSGKTAVLVERIISRITSKERPVNIDQLLIVTFTKAAAGEMRDRIGKALEEKSKECPDDTHLQKQLTLLYNAQITTIDSFCLYVIRNYFHTIDLDPSFRIAEEAELTLLRSDVIAKLLEERYETQEEYFLQFIEMYSAAKTDVSIEALIQKLYRFSISYPYPKEWLMQRKQDFEVDSMHDMEQSVWMQHALLNIANLIDEAIGLNQKAIDLCYQGGPVPYMEALISDQELLVGLKNIKTYKEYDNAFSEISFARLSTKKDLNTTQQQKEQIKSIRDTYKDILKEIRKQYFYQEPEEMLRDIQGVKQPMNVLIDLTIDFIERLALAKEEANIVDFSDLEHYALQILLKKENGAYVPTPAARDFSEQFEEIMIDEYQDSNYVQEYILNSISRVSQGKNNLFMVGDVKQSIYKFRMACPELFMEKYNRYKEQDGDCQKIELSKNFRSRHEVLDSVNHIFQKIMCEAFGKIEYTDKVALYPGASFNEPDYVDEYKTEMIVLQTESEAEGAVSETDELIEEYNERELEARAIAQRIKQIIQEGKFQYKDIVIILRTMANWSEVFLDVLKEEQIPAHCETQSGYFRALEVRTVLNYLRVLDNPMQDLAFAAVLYSPFAQLSAQDLALLRIQVGKEEKKQNLYESARNFCLYEYEDDEKLELKKKLEQFFSSLDYLRARKSCVLVHDLIDEMYQKTGYDSYVLAMPQGQQRYDNLQMLITRAMEYEQSSYHGLFQFIRYIERLLKYEVDYGEAITESSMENSVRIMSIHKSKGLEFPVVILGGMGKQFNQMDSRDKILLHSEYGIGPDYIDLNQRCKIPTLMKKVIQEEIIKDNLAEELRVLYVALTRAKEKLIMIGTVKDYAKEEKKWTNAMLGCHTHLSIQTLASAKNFFSFVGPVSLEDSTIQIKVMSVGDLLVTSINQEKESLERQALFEQLNQTESKEEALRKQLLQKLYFSYPYEKEAKLPIKTTVSELKKLGQMQDEELSQMLQEVQAETTAIKEFEPTIPKFLSTETQVSGAGYGTIVHKIMQHMDFCNSNSIEDLKKLISSLVQQLMIPPEMEHKISVSTLYAFLKTDLCERIRQAQAKNKLWREQQFVLGVSATQIDVSFDTKDSVLIQGIIDLYFEEEDGIVLVDYKTDRVQEGQESLLIQRYQKQLEYYAQAIERLTKKPVKERLVYSFALAKVIQVGV